MDKTNPGGLVALTIGLTAALATVVVALINGRQSRRDARENLKRDIELVKQLQDGRAKEMLERLIAEEIAHLGLTQSMKGERTVFLWTAMAAISAGITLLGIEIAAGRATVGFAVRMFAFAAIGLFLLLGSCLYRE